MLGRIQVLRGVAAYMVVFFHIILNLRAAFNLDIPEQSIGAFGVDIFFVISGFIMAHVTRPDETPHGFLRKRLFRVAPLYWLVTVLAVVIALVRPWYMWGALVSPGPVIASLLFLPSADLDGNLFPIMSVGWTLNFEMLFYGLFALTLLLPAGRRMAALIAAMAAVFILANLTPASSVLRFYANPIIFEFAAGCLLAVAIRQPGLVPALKALPPWLFIGVGILGLAISPFGETYAWARPLRWGAPAVFIVFGVVLLDVFGKPIKSRLFKSLGDASYSAYLLHMLLLPAVALTFARFFSASLSVLVLTTVACLVVTALVSALSFKMFERPSVKLLQRLYEHTFPARKPA